MKEIGGDLLSHTVAHAVPLAQESVHGDTSRVQNGTGKTATHEATKNPQPAKTS